MRIGARMASVATIALALATGQAHAQSHPQSGKSSRSATADRKTTTVQYGGWKVTCDEAVGQVRPVCSAALRIIDKERNATILTWLVGHSRDDRLLSEFYVPTEVLIAPGVGVSLEGGPRYKADYVSCGRSACKAVLPLDAALTSELANATTATLALTASTGKVTRFSMGIEGIEAALAALEN